MSRPSRTCSTLNCGRVHFARGYCERCYRAERRKGRLSRDVVPPTGPRVDCGWCQKVMVPGTEPISTGICPDCFSKHFPEIEASV